MTKPTIGERLRRARESNGTSLYKASRETKIRVDFLELMERDNFRFVSGGTYVRGLLRGYSKYLGLPEEELTQELEQVHGTQPAPTLQQILREPARAAPRRRRPRWLVAAAAAAGTLLAMSFVGLMQPAGPNVAQPPRPTQAGSASPNVSLPPTNVAQVPTIRAVRLTVGVVGARCWMRVLADGNTVLPIFEGTLLNGESRSFEANELITVTFGNLGAVRVTVNGVDLGAPGSPGQVGTFRFGPDTTEFG